MNTKPSDSKLVPEVQRQYSLLREFNLEQAKAGETILYVHYRTPEAYVEVIYRGCTKSQEQVYVEYENGNGRVIPCTEIKMKPLCWIEGKPVYKGDTLYLLKDQKYFLVSGLYENLDGVVMGLDSNLGWSEIEALTWDKPHVHQELIDAFKNGAEIQYWSCLTEYGYQWKDISKPSWCVKDKYRVKPKKKYGWVNLWKSGGSLGVSTGVSVYTSKQKAQEGLNLSDLVDTIEIHWEE